MNAQPTFRAKDRSQYPLGFGGDLAFFNDIVEECNAISPSPSSRALQMALFYLVPAFEVLVPQQCGDHPMGPESEDSDSRPLHKEPTSREVEAIVSGGFTPIAAELREMLDHLADVLELFPDMVLGSVEWWVIAEHQTCVHNNITAGMGSWWSLLQQHFPEVGAFLIPELLMQWEHPSPEPWDSDLLAQAFGSDFGYQVGDVDSEPEAEDIDPDDLPSYGEDWFPVAQDPKPATDATLPVIAYKRHIYPPGMSGDVQAFNDICSEASLLDDRHNSPVALVLEAALMEIALPLCHAAPAAHTRLPPPSSDPQDDTEPEEEFPAVADHFYGVVAAALKVLDLRRDIQFQQGGVWSDAHICESKQLLDELWCEVEGWWAEVLILFPQIGSCQMPAVLSHWVGVDLPGHISHDETGDMEDTSDATPFNLPLPGSSDDEYSEDYDADDFDSLSDSSDGEYFEDYDADDFDYRSEEESAEDNVSSLGQYSDYSASELWYDAEASDTDDEWSPMYEQDIPDDWDLEPQTVPASSKISVWSKITGVFKSPWSKRKVKVA